MYAKSTIGYMSPEIYSVVQGMNSKYQIVHRDKESHDRTLA